MRTRFPVRWLLAPAVAAVLAGLALLPARGSDHAEFDLGPPAPRLEALDPARAAKMAELAAAAERVRGLKLTKQPPWMVRNQREVYRFFLRGIQAEANPREISLATKVYAAFGFWKPDFDLLGAQLEATSGAVRAFYNSNDGNFTLVRSMGKSGLARGADLQEDAEVVHEYTHALQSQNGMMAGLSMAGGNDRAQAARALVEGDAVLTMCAYAVGRISGPEAETNPAILGPVLKNIRGGMAAMLQSPMFKKHPPVIGATMVFSYTDGSAFVEAVYKQGGWAEVNRCYQVPPISTEQIIHPAKYLQPVPEDPVEIETPDLAAPLLPGAQIIDVDTLGEMTIKVLLAGFVPQADARRAAEGWGGDLYAAIERTAGADKGEIVLAWVTAWDTENDAKEFFETYARALDKKTGVERQTLREGALLDWRGAAKREARLELRGSAVLAIEGADAAETDRLAKYFWALKRSAPKPRHRQP